MQGTGQRKKDGKNVLKAIMAQQFFLSSRLLEKKILMKNRLKLDT